MLFNDNHNSQNINTWLSVGRAQQCRPKKRNPVGLIHRKIREDVCRDDCSPCICTSFVTRREDKQQLAMPTAAVVRVENTGLDSDCQWAGLSEGSVVSVNFNQMTNVSPRTS